MICEIQNTFDSDGTVLSSIENKEDKKLKILAKDDDDFNKNLSMGMYRFIKFNKTFSCIYIHAP